MGDDVCQPLCNFPLHAVNFVSWLHFFQGISLTLCFKNIPQISKNPRPNTAPKKVTISCRLGDVRCQKLQ